MACGLSAGFVPTAAYSRYQCQTGRAAYSFAENAAIDPTALMQLISEQQQYMNFKSGVQAQLIFRTVKLKTDSLTWLEKNLPRLAFD